MPNALMTWHEAVLWLRSQNDKQDLVRACYFDDPLIEAAQRYYASDEWLAVEELIAQLPKDRALDIGAGRGISSYALAKSGWKVTALEPDQSDLVGAGAIRSLARQAALDIDVIEHWGEGLPFEDARFGLVYMRQALHHARDLQALCREAHRVLAKGGMFMATREHVVDGPKSLRAFLDAHPLHKLYGGENAYTLDQYLDAIKGAGFEHIKTIATFDSIINLFPMSFDDIKGPLGLNLPKPLMPLWRAALNRLNKTPGRLYTFIAWKT